MRSAGCIINDIVDIDIDIKLLSELKTDLSCKQSKYY